VASRPIRIEIRGVASERDEAQRDLRETLSALEEKLLPRRAVRRLVTQHHPALVLAGLVAAGVSIGLLGDDDRTVRRVGLVAAGVAGIIALRLATR
jgi:hypothetical protein